jgi:hypothetical protein
MEVRPFRRDPLLPAKRQNYDMRLTSCGLTSLLNARMVLTKADLEFCGCTWQAQDS